MSVEAVSCSRGYVRRMVKLQVFSIVIMIGFAGLWDGRLRMGTEMKDWAEHVVVLVGILYRALWYFRSNNRVLPTQILHIYKSQYCMTIKTRTDERLTERKTCC